MISMAYTLRPSYCILMVVANVQGFHPATSAAFRAFATGSASFFALPGIAENLSHNLRRSIAGLEVCFFTAVWPVFLPWLAL